MLGTTDPPREPTKAPPDGGVHVRSYLLSLVITIPVLFLAGLVSLRHEWPALLAVLRQPHSLAWLAASGLLSAVNWLVFIYAVATGHVLEAQPARAARGVAELGVHVDEVLVLQAR